MADFLKQIQLHHWRFLYQQDLIFVYKKIKFKKSPGAFNKTEKSKIFDKFGL